MTEMSNVVFELVQLWFDDFNFVRKDWLNVSIIIFKRFFDIDLIFLEISIVIS